MLLKSTQTGVLFKNHTWSWVRSLKNMSKFFTTNSFIQALGPFHLIQINAFNLISELTLLIPHIWNFTAGFYYLIIASLWPILMISLLMIIDLRSTKPLLIHKQSIMVDILIKIKTGITRRKPAFWKFIIQYEYKNMDKYNHMKWKDGKNSL